MQTLRHPARRALQAQAQNQAEQQAAASDFLPVFMALAAVHILLALLMYRFRPELPTAYAITVALAGVYFLKDKTPTRLVYLCAYLAGAELLWRMTKADVFWELGKYLAVALMFLGAMRWRVRLYGPAIVFFLLLLPGIVPTLGFFSLADARDAISFNLSGPLALSLGVAFMNGIKLNRDQVSRLLLVSLLSIIGVATLAARSTLTAEIIQFNPESNFVTSGGYGPNQVSAILGLGTLLAVLYLFVARPRGARWWFMLAVSVIFLVQSILTFSRGGVLNLVIAIPAAAFFFLAGGGRQQRGILALLVVLAGLVYLLTPLLNEYTGGMLQARYQDLDTTGRMTLIQADINTWRQNPYFGVGVGIGEVYRVSVVGALIASHTEYTRLLAEHGIPGILAVLLLGLMALQALRRAKGSLSRGMVAGMALWVFVEMTHAAMRVVAIPLVFAIPFACLAMDEDA